MLLLLMPYIVNFELSSLTHLAWDSRSPRNRRR